MNRTYLILLIVFFSIFLVCGQSSDSCLHVKDGYLVTVSKISHQVSKTESFQLVDWTFYENAPSISYNSNVDSIIKNGTLFYVKKYAALYINAPKNDAHKQYLHSSIFKKLSLKDSTQVTIRKVILTYGIKTIKVVDYINRQRGPNSASFLNENDVNSKFETNVIYPELIIGNN
jgi:hypothetical protein